MPKREKQAFITGVLVGLLIVEVFVFIRIVLFEFIR